jgi:predicted MFS family arabinose efflux permease
LAARLFDEFGVFLPEGSYESFRADLGLDYSHASWVLIAIAPGAIAGNAFAIAADFGSRRVIAAFGALGFAASLLMFGLGHSFVVLVVAAFLIGMCTTAMVDASELALIDVSGEEREDNIARSFAFSSIGDLVGPVMLIVVTSVGLSWRATFLVGAVLMTLYGVWLASLPLPAPVEHPHLGGWRDGLRDAWRLPAVWYVASAALLIGPLDETFIAFLIAKLQRVDGLSLAMASAIVLSSIVGDLVGFGLAPRMRAPALTPSAAMLVVAAAACAVLPWYLVPIAAITFGYALARAWLSVKFRMMAIRPERRGTISAIVSTIEFGGFLLPLAAGALADAYGLQAAMGFFVVVALVLLCLSLVAQANKARAI